MRLTLVSFSDDRVRVIVSPVAASPASALANVTELTPLAVLLVAGSGILVTPALSPIAKVAVNCFPSARLIVSLLSASVTL